LLAFVGASDEVQEATSVIGLGMVSMSERLDDLQPVLVAVTAIIGGRLVAAIVTVTKVKATAVATTLAYEAAVVRLAFQSGVAAGAQYTLATTATAATRAMALVGGPT